MGVDKAGEPRQPHVGELLRSEQDCVAEDSESVQRQFRLGAEVLMVSRGYEERSGRLPNIVRGSVK